MPHWAVLFDSRDKRQAEDFIQTMTKVCQNLHIKIGQPQKVALKNDRLESYTTELRNVIKPELNIVVVIMRSNRNDYYSAIKK